MNNINERQKDIEVGQQKQGRRQGSPTDTRGGMPEHCSTPQSSSVDDKKNQNKIHWKVVVKAALVLKHVDNGFVVLQLSFSGQTAVKCRYLVTSSKYRCLMAGDLRYVQITIFQVRLLKKLRVLKIQE